MVTMLSEPDLVNTEPVPKDALKLSGRSATSITFSKVATVPETVKLRKKLDMLLKKKSDPPDVTFTTSSASSVRIAVLLHNELKSV
jgi:hypothetical protein